MAIASLFWSDKIALAAAGAQIVSPREAPELHGIVDRLCALAEDFGSEVHISQEELGVYVGAARESVNRQLQEWRRAGIIELHRGRISLLDVERLNAAAASE